jgi:hypothetical protein
MTNQDSAKSAEERVADEHMLCRSIRLNEKVDAQLRGIAHTLGVSKADIIRYCISTGLRDITGKDWTNYPALDPAAREQIDRIQAFLNRTNDRPRP